MNKSDHLARFIDAQQGSYDQALNEIKNGRKRGHWMWYIFPQLLGLGHTATSTYYAIKNLQEAQQYLAHPVLGARLVEISKALLEQQSRDVHAIFGWPDELKLKSSITLFSLVPNAPPVLLTVLDAFFGGEQDQQTLALLG